MILQCNIWSAVSCSVSFDAHVNPPVAQALLPGSLSLGFSLPLAANPVIVIPNGVRGVRNHSFGSHVELDRKAAAGIIFLAFPVKPIPAQPHYF
jgi:hypothetical protein